MTPSPRPRKLILGTIWGYGYAELEPFLTTLKRTGYDGDVVFFHNGLSPATLRKIAADGVRLIPFSGSFPYIEPALAAHNRWGTLPMREDVPLQKAYYFFMVRHLLHYCFLQEYGSQYDVVFMTDIRDVIFQSDPFDFPIEGLCCFLEKAGVTLGDPTANRNWILAIFGEATLERIADKPVTCAGTVYGTVPTALAYLDAMVSTIVKQGGSIADQGIHNYVIHTGLVPHVTFYDNDSGPVLTLVLEDTIRFDPNGRVINKEGQIPPVVHQYDRHWIIAKRYYSPALKLRVLWRIIRPARMLRIVRYHLARAAHAVLPETGYRALARIARR